MARTGWEMKAVWKVAALVSASALAAVLVACGGGGSAASSASLSAGSASASAESASAPAAVVVGEGPAGTAWSTSVLMGALPDEQPAAKDDLYTHYNYDYLAAHQEYGGSTIGDCTGELQAAIAEIVHDSSKTGHDLEQLRIFYNQAADIDALRAIGLSEVQPYLDRIEAVTTIDEMNALLADEDFPFSPFIEATVSTNDTRASNIVSIDPNFVLFDAQLFGGAYYQDSDDPQVQENLDLLVSNAASTPLADFIIAGMGVDDATAAVQQIVDFEKAHGRYIDSHSTFVNADYGALTDAMRDSYHTLDEMCAMAPNLPLAQMLEKLGKAGSQTYIVTPAWLKALNGLWTEDNLETIKLVARAKVLGETRPYRDPSAMNDAYAAAGMAVPSADEFAYAACESLDTLGNVVARLYVEDVLGPAAKARLTALSEDLVAAYKDVVNGTAWMSGESRERVIEKLDHMTLNVLEPAGGYFDYSGLSLVPTEEGGTLLGNYLKLKQYRYDCEEKLIGKPAVAASVWFRITPTMGNAFYDTTSNSINVYPGFVTSLVYADDMDDTELLAGAGFVIAHEISHGFDYTGSQLDAYGQPNLMFADADIDAFVLKCSLLALYYGRIEIWPGQTVNGQLVVDEAAADLTGMQVSLQLASKIDGFDYDEYYAGVANLWAEVQDADALQLLTLDVHPQSNLRVNVSAQMLDELYDALGVAEGDGMYLAPEERIVIWGPDA